MAALEEKLANFKREEMDQLPELMDLNLRQLEQAESGIEETEEEIRALQDKQLALQAELALTSPYRERFTESGERVLSAEEKLTTLTVQFLSAAGRYSPDHPDMLRMRREIETLANQSGGSSRIGALVGELQLARAQLIEARRQYSEDHPDVKQIAGRVSSLEGAVRGAARAPLSVDGARYSAPPDNPQYVVLQTQLRTVGENLIAERKRIERLNDEVAEYTRRLFLTPTVERDYLNLSRGYESAHRKYGEIKDKQLQALLAERLEKQELAERFTILESAGLSDEPEWPNRKAIIVVGAMFGLISGLGIATMCEFFDGSVRGFRAVASIFSEPPLAAIGYIQIDEEIFARRTHILQAVFATFAGIAVAILALHFLWMPVDDAWNLYSPWAVDVLDQEENTK